jgi:hypothetical protein
VAIFGLILPNQTNFSKKVGQVANFEDPCPDERCLFGNRPPLPLTGVLVFRIPHIRPGHESKAKFQYIPVHYAPGILFLQTDMTTPVLSPTTTNADPTTSQGQEEKEQSQSNDPDCKILLRKDFGFLPVPRHLRYDPTKPFHFGLLLNIAFGFASTFSECFDSPPLFRTLDWLNFHYSCRESLLLSANTQ